MTDETSPAGQGEKGDQGDRGETGVGAALPLRRVVLTGIEMLGDLRDPPAAVSSGRLERLLRIAVERHTTSTGDGHAALPALRTACAHLQVGELEDAYLALTTARDLLR